MSDKKRPVSESAARSDQADQRLLSALASLPRERASAGFTQEVMQRIERRVDSAPSRRYLTLPLAAGVALALSLPIGGWLVSKVSERRQLDARVAEIESLERRHQQLLAELSQMRDSLDETPVVYLGGDDQIGFTVDLRSLMQQAERRGQSQGRIRPASVEISR